MTTRQFVTFRIDGHLLGVDVLHVREINRALDITPVQLAPAYVRGLVNLRGQAVTVLDLGVRLGLGRRVVTPESHNIVLKRDEVGLLVDAIGDVVQADGAEVGPPPANLEGIAVEFVEGIVKLPDGLLLVLAVEPIRAPGPAPSGRLEPRRGGEGRGGE